MSTKLTDAFKVSMQDVNKTVANEYATVTRVNSNKTVNVKPDSNDADSDDLTNISYVVDLDLSVGDRVVLSYLNNDPNEPIIIGMLNPKSSPNVDCRSIVSIDKVESEGLVDVYRITYDKVPIYSYFSVTNGTTSSSVPPELAGKTIQCKVLIDSKTITNVNSVTFDGLNGDVDKKYIIEFEGSMANQSPDMNIILKPNNISTNQMSSSFRQYTTNYDRMSSTNLILCGGGFQTALTGNFKSEFDAKSGKNRRIITNYNYEDVTGNYSLGGEGNGVWRDMTTIVTSLVIATTAYTFSGTIKLYKMVDVTYPTN